MENVTGDRRQYAFTFNSNLDTPRKLCFAYHKASRNELLVDARITDKIQYKQLKKSIYKVQFIRCLSPGSNSVKRNSVFKRNSTSAAFLPHVQLVLSYYRDTNSTLIHTWHFCHVESNIYTMEHLC